MADEPLDRIEQRLTAHLRDEAASLHAPADLWARVRSTGPSERRRRRVPRWVALPAVAAAAAVALFFVTLIASSLWDDDTLDSGDILARAAAAAEDPASVGLESYTGTFEVRSSRALDEQGDEVIGSVRLWVKPPDRFRAELERDDGTYLPSVVSDGETAWIYDADSNTYEQKPASNALTTEEAGPGDLFLFGLPGGTRVEDLLEPIRQSADGEVSLTEGEPVLGRETYRIDIDEDDGSTRMWLDKQYFLLLRMEQDAPTPERRSLAGGITFTSLDINPQIDDSVFTFTPPPGAIEVEDVGLVQVAFHDLALSPTWLPEGYEVTESSELLGRSDGHSRYRFERFLAKGYIEINQEWPRTEVPAAQRTGDQIAVKGQEAWLSRDGAGAATLTWLDGEILVTVKADELSDDELLRFADSMVPAPEVGEDVPAEEDYAEEGDYRKWK